MKKMYILKNHFDYSVGNSIKVVVHYYVGFSFSRHTVRLHSLTMPYEWNDHTPTSGSLLRSKAEVSTFCSPTIDCNAHDFWRVCVCKSPCKNMWARS